MCVGDWGLDLVRDTLLRALAVHRESGGGGGGQRSEVRRAKGRGAGREK